MLITRKSEISGIERTVDIPCTEEQYNAYLSSQHIQYAMPNVSASDREFIITGITQEEWDSVFPEEEDDELLLQDVGCPHCGSYEGDYQECPECGHGQ